LEKELTEIWKKERQEDREEMVKMMDSFVEEKVSKTIAPFNERTEKFVKAMLDMNEQEMCSVKEKIGTESGQSSTVHTMTVWQGRKFQQAAPDVVHVINCEDRMTWGQSLSYLIKKLTSMTLPEWDKRKKYLLWRNKFSLNLSSLKQQ
jgi:hypothetical protein